MFYKLLPFRLDLNIWRDKYMGNGQHSKIKRIIYCFDSKIRIIFDYKINCYRLLPFRLDLKISIWTNSYMEQFKEMLLFN